MDPEPSQPLDYGHPAPRRMPWRWPILLSVWGIGLVIWLFYLVVLGYVLLVIL